MTHLHTHSISQMVEHLANKDYSALELTEHFLTRIEASDLNAFVHINENARKDAIKADEARAAGDTRPLLGIPMGHKDNICTQDTPTSCASKMLDGYISPYTATLAQNTKNAGFIHLGKTNMDEFAMGSGNETSYFGACLNPWDKTRVPGGSSGGSAAAVAAGLVPCATGTDTGGSIRQPASFCGITGIKPTYGRVSRFGVVAYASSLDQAGAMGKSAKDCAYLLNAMSGHDPKDATSIKRQTCDFVKACQVSDEGLKGLTIAVPDAYFADGLDAGVKAVVLDAVKTYEGLGATIMSLDIMNPAISLAAYYILASAEASSNLSRFDGVRFGYRCKGPKDLEDLYTRTRGEGFGIEVKRRILMGTYALSAGYFDAYYTKAQKVRRLVLEDLKRAFGQCDLILSPTAPTPAYTLGEDLPPATRYLGDVYTIGANLGGLPSISHPAGFVNGLPVGVQLMADHWQESLLFRAAAAFETQNTAHATSKEL